MRENNEFCISWPYGNTSRGCEWNINTNHCKLANFEYDPNTNSNQLFVLDDSKEELMVVKAVF
ncbi:hypothetical protein J6590_071622 [Homalodisca vitripennis]|nr:hypothetical protein J6590_071622 [Homalodisca vitripennis]